MAVNGGVRLCHIISSESNLRDLLLSEDERRSGNRRLEECSFHFAVMTTTWFIIIFPYFPYEIAMN